MPQSVFYMHVRVAWSGTVETCLDLMLDRDDWLDSTVSLDGALGSHPLCGIWSLETV